MASADPLTMSLDDIIKSKRQGKRGGNTNQKGQANRRQQGNNNNNNSNNRRNNDRPAANTDKFAEFRRGKANKRGRAAGGNNRNAGNNGGGKPLRIMTAKFGAKNGARGKNTLILQGGRLNRGRRGKGFVTGGRRNDSNNDQMRREGVSTSGRQFGRGQFQQQRKSLSSIQELNRNIKRNEILNQRRGLNSGMKTSSNLGAPLRVRVGNGTIVRGLRSDQLLLQKIRQSKKSHVQSRLEKLEAFRDDRDWSQKGRDSSLESNAIVSLSSHRGLTVSIKNNRALQALHNGSASRNRHGLSKHKSKKSQEDMFAPATFTIVNDHVNSYDSDFEEIPDPARRAPKRNIITTRESRPRNAAPLSIGADLRSLPDPHRQILDPKIQKEIAMLQGKEEVTLNSGPGPGVKGFKHVPSQTQRSLNERFTTDRIVMV